VSQIISPFNHLEDATAMPLKTCLLALLFMGACGSSDSPPVDAPVIDTLSIDSAVDAAATEGLLTITVNNITGGTGKIVLVGVLGSNGFAANICEAVSADPGTVSAIARTPGSSNPCDLGADHIFPNGTYDLTGGLYTPGSQTPDLCTSGSVTILGDTTVVMPDLAACAN
jgi:hypothetical protein